MGDKYIIQPLEERAIDNIVTRDMENASFLSKTKTVVTSYAVEFGVPAVIGAAINSSSLEDMAKGAAVGALITLPLYAMGRALKYLKKDYMAPKGMEYKKYNMENKKDYLIIAEASSAKRTGTAIFTPAFCALFYTISGSLMGRDTGDAALVGLGTGVVAVFAYLAKGNKTRQMVDAEIERMRNEQTPKEEVAVIEPH